MSNRRLSNQVVFLTAVVGAMIWIRGSRPQGEARSEASATVATSTRMPASANVEKRSVRFFPVRSYAELMQLKPYARELYVEAVREALVEASEQMDSETEFASVGRENPGAAILRLVASRPAYAVSDAPTCIYAGWVLQYDGRYCHRPPACDGRAGQVQCQPLVFGPGVCAPAGRSATAACRNRMKSLSVTADYASHHEAEWNQLKASLDSYCTSGKQSAVCAIVQKRILAVEPSVTGGLPDAETVEVRGPRPATVSSFQSAPAAGSKLMTRNCFPGRLLNEVRTSNDVKEPMMEYKTAYALGCRHMTISEVDMNKARQRVDHDNGVIRSSNLPNKKELLDWNTAMLANLERCNADAKAHPEPIERDLNAPGAKIRFDTPVVTTIHPFGPGTSGTAVVGERNYLGYNLLYLGVHLCNTVLEQPGSNPSQAPAATFSRTTQ